MMPQVSADDRSYISSSLRPPFRLGGKMFNDLSALSAAGPDGAAPPAAKRMKWKSYDLANLIISDQ